MLTINIIGAGNLGKTIAHLFVKNKVCKIHGVLNSSLENAEKAVKFIQQGTPLSSLSELPPADIHFITTRDDLIEIICNKMVEEKKFKAGNIIIHCSGALTSEILLKAKQLNCFVASVHPAKSFADPSNVIKNFANTFCVVEGDEEALNIVNKMFASIDGKILKIKAENKVKYHAACVFANNYVVILHKEASGLYQEAEIPSESAKEITTSNMQTAIDNVKNKNHQEALTGPLARGDLGTIKKHVDVLKHRSHLQKLYQVFGLLALPITKHSEANKNEIELSLISKPLNI